MKNKAQAAMEFLMTYGWAILVVLVVIGALAYFGVLSPAALLPEKCMLPIGLECEEHYVSGLESRFVIRNGMGGKITINSFKVIDDDGNVVCSFGGTTIMIQNGKSATVPTFCNNIGEVGDKEKYSLEVTYYEGDDVAFTHTGRGELLSKVEEIDAIGYWKFDGNVEDSTGKGNHGTVMGATVTSESKIGEAYDFGTNDYVEVPGVEITGDFTYAAWIRPFDNMAGYQCILGKDYSWRAGMFLSNARLQGYMPYGPVGPPYEGTGGQGTGVVVDDVWQHVVMIHDTSSRNIKLYFNGQEVEYLQEPVAAPDYAPENVPGDLSAYLFKIGNNAVDSGGNLHTFVGQIDEVIVWGRVLSATEIAGLYGSYS